MMFRSPKLLAMAKDAPRCFCCSRDNRGDVVAAHSNQLRDGKGKGIKAHDFRIAYICGECHSSLDQGKNWSREQRVEIFEAAHRATIGWLFETGRVKVA